MNRRSFLSIIFGTVAAKAAIPLLPKSAPDIQGICDRMSRKLDWRAFMYATEFDLSADPLGKIVHFNGDSSFLLHGFNLQFFPDCDWKGVDEVLNSTYLTLKLGDRTYAECGTWQLPREGHKLYHPLGTGGLPLSVSLDSHDGWKAPEGIKGQMIIHGMKAFPT